MATLDARCPFDRPRSFDDAFVAAYDRLRRTARRQIRGTGLSAGDLVHEAWLRLRRDRRCREVMDPEHAVALVRLTMRRIAIDAARRCRLDPGAHRRAAESRSSTVDRARRREAVREAVDHVAREHSRASAQVQLRVGHGRPAAEAAKLLGIARSTAAEDWSTVADALRARLDPDDRD